MLPSAVGGLSSLANVFPSPGTSAQLVMAETKPRPSDLPPSTDASSERRRNQLTCGLCQNIYQSPKLLQCLHTYCCRCLEKLVQTEGQFNQTILCPDPRCRQTLPVPPGGAQSFADNQYINREDLERARRAMDASNRDIQTSRGTETHEEETLPLRSIASTITSVRRSQSEIVRPNMRRSTSGNAATAKPPHMCPQHANMEVVLCCIDCDEALCCVCQPVGHSGHMIKYLPEAAQAYRKQLVADHKRLASSVHRMEKLSDLAQSNLRSARQKADILKEEVNAQYDLLVAMADEKRNKVLEGLDAIMANVDPTLTSDVRRIQEVLDSYTRLLHRVRYALAPDSDDADTVTVAKEMKDGMGSPQELNKIRGEEFKPQYTLRPGLHSYSRTLKKTLESTIVRFFGSPVSLTMLNTETSQCVPPTSPVPFFRCGAGARREIHAICRADDGKLYVAYGGKMPYCNEEEMVVIPLQRTTRAYAAGPYRGTEPVPVNTGRKITFDKSRRGSVPVGTDQYNANDTQIIQANSNGNFLIKTRIVHFALSRGPRRHCKKTIIERKQPEGDTDSESPPFSMEVNAVPNPIAFDANANGCLFVIVNEDREAELYASHDSAHSVSGVVNTVRLYHQGERDPIATYTSPAPDPQHFLPTAVSFWKHGQQDLLLIADWLNNSVHMVHVGSGTFKFLCYLTAGAGDLIRPTALDVDADKNIWIGCENGWVLECPFRNQSGFDDVDSLLSQILHIANPEDDIRTPSSSVCSHASSSSTAPQEIADDGDVN